MFELTTFFQITFFTAMVCSICYGLLFLLITIPSTEYSAPRAWVLNFINGDQRYNAKSTLQFRVRPVSALY